MTRLAVLFPLTLLLVLFAFARDDTPSEVDGAATTRRLTRLIDRVRVEHLRSGALLDASSDPRLEALTPFALDGLPWRLLDPPAPGATDSVPAVARTTHAEARLSPPALEVAASTPRNASLRFGPLPVKGDTHYTFVGHVRTENVVHEGDGVSGTFLLEERSSHGVSTFHAGESRSGTSAGWETVVMPLLTRSTSTQLIAHACLGAPDTASGRALFDDMVLFEHHGPVPDDDVLAQLADEVARHPWRFESLISSRADLGRDPNWGPETTPRLRGRIELGDGVRTALLAPVPTRYEIPLPEGAAANLRLALGARHRTERPGLDALVFAARLINAEGHEAPLFEGRLGDLDPERRGRWVERALALPPTPPGARLVLTTSGPPELTGAAAYLGDLVLERAEPATRPPRHVLLFSLDTLGADHLSGFGYELPTSPFLDRLARRGVAFERAFAPAPFTLPSQMSLLTGLSPTRHQVFVANRPRLANDTLTLAKAFQSRGFRTVGLHAGGLVSPSYGFADGFDVYDRLSGDAAATPTGHAMLGQTLEHALQISREHADQDLFLFVHTYLTHTPYTDFPAHLDEFGEAFDALHAELGSNADVDGLGSSRVLERWSAGQPAPDAASVAMAELLYAGEIRALDTLLERHFARLEAQLGGVERTVAITSDHGDAFFDHGLMLHGNSLYNELLHVPLIVLGAPGAKAGTRVSEPVSLVDVAPTLLAAAGLSPGRALDGRSLLPLLRGETGESARALDASLVTPGHSLFAVIADGHKYIVDATTGAEELYDLDTDFGEQENLAATHPERVARLRADLAPSLARLPGLHLAWRGAERSIEWRIDGLVDGARVRRFSRSPDSLLEHDEARRSLHLRTSGATLAHPWVNVEPLLGTELSLRLRVDGAAPRPEDLRLPDGPPPRPDAEGRFALPLARLVPPPGWQAPGDDAPAGLYAWLIQPAAARELTLDAEQISQLRALGYLK